MGDNRRAVPLDDKERDEALKPYRIYGRTVTAALSKLYEFLSDEPLDSDEREAHIEVVTMVCYSYNLTAADPLIACTICVGSALAARAPAIKKKWFDDKKPKRAPDTTMQDEVEKARVANAKPIEGVRLTPVPEPVVS